MSKLDELLADLDEEIINYETVTLTRREYDLLRSALRDAQYVPALLNLRCPGNNGCDDPVQCQSYEASEQSAPCPAGCCVMAEEKDVRSIIAAIDEENAP